MNLIYCNHCSLEISPKSFCEKEKDAITLKVINVEYKCCPKCGDVLEVGVD